MTLTAEQALAQLDAALDAIAGVELAPADIAEAVELARRVERAGRRVHAMKVDVIAAVSDRGLHLADGHASGRLLVGHVAQLSEPEARRRDRARRMLAEMPAVRAGLVGGLIGICQIDRIARVFVNPRVSAEFVNIHEQVAHLAAVLPYEELDRRLTNWVRQVDEDGTADRAKRACENRRARIVQDFDGGWELLCLVGGLSGAQMQVIFRAFVEAEFQADWAEAREIHGDATTVEHLARTFDQRDADAVERIFEFAANAFAAAPGGSRIDLSIVIDSDTFEREARRQAGAEVEPRPVPDLGPLPDEEPGPWPGSAGEPAVVQHPGRAFRCETSDGHPIHPTEAFAAALAGRIRRMVVGWDSVVLDMSGYHTLYRGPLRDAVMLLRTGCPWPACTVKIRHCEADHLQPRRTGGRTNPDNGGPACGRHNRLKEHGFTVRRDERGRLHIHRPDGTEIDY